MARMRGARFLAEGLEAYGVSHVFLVPTVLTHTLVEMERRTKIVRVVTHSEKAAAYMADGYARAGRRPGVCMAQMVGAANLAAGLRDAYLGCSPVLALTGSPPARASFLQGYQQVDDRPAFTSVTKMSFHASTADRLPDLLRQCFRVSTSGKPGPTHLGLSGSHGDDPETDEADLEVLAEERFAKVPAFRPQPEPDSVRAALACLEAATRPVVIAGGGVRASGAEAELLRLCGRLSIPIVTSMNAKDTIPSDHPLSAGVVGLYSRESANRVVLESDLVFFVGSQAGGQVTNQWRVPPRGARVVQLDIEPTQLGRHYPNAVSLVGDARVALESLIGEAERLSPPDRGGWLERVSALNAEWRAELGGFLTSDSVPIRPERLCHELSRIMPDTALVVADTGHAGMWTGIMLELNVPTQGYIRAAGSLGWALPAGLGAKLASPERPVVIFTGDGGLWDHIAEIETAVRWGIGVVVVVNNNHALNQEIHPYLEAYGGKLHGRHEELWHFTKVDMAAVARSMGAGAMQVTRPDEIEPQLRTAIEQAMEGRPVIVDVVTDISATAPLAYT